MTKLERANLRIGAVQVCAGLVARPGDTEAAAPVCSADEIESFRREGALNVRRDAGADVIRDDAVADARGA